MWSQGGRRAVAETRAKIVAVEEKLAQHRSSTAAARQRVGAPGCVCVCVWWWWWCVWLCLHVRARVSNMWRCGCVAVCVAERVCPHTVSCLGVLRECGGVLCECGGV